MKTLIYCTFSLLLSISYSQEIIPEIQFIESSSGKFGLADTHGNILVDTIYDENIYASLNTVSGEAVLKKNNEWMIINYKNEMVLNLSAYSSFSTSFSHNLLSVTDAKTGLSGYIDRNGKTVLPFKFEMTFSFEEKLPYASASVKGRWGVINLQGEWVLAPKYGHVYEIISENEFIVLIKNVYYGVNKKGEILYEEELGC